MADTTVPYSTGDSKIGDTTIAEMRELAARYPVGRSALLPMLHLVQSVEGRVTPEGIEACADVLGLTGAEVSAVATFYTMYKRRPVGDYHVGVCTNTLCAIMGGDLTSLASSRRSSTSSAADSGVMSSKNSQLTIITGA